MCIHFDHPTKKAGLCEALHGRRPWPELELPWEPMGSSPERGRRGKGGEEAEGRGLGAAWGGGGLQGGRHGGSTLLLVWPPTLFARCA
jgi:hypothetical protein